MEAVSAQQVRLGQELHDGIGQQLVGLRYMAETLLGMLPETQKREVELVTRISDEIKNTLKQVRDLSRGMVRGSVDADGLMTALHDLASRCGELFAIECTFECELPVVIPSDLVASQFYRIAQEAIINAVKHGQAKHVSVELREGAGTIQLDIVDNGDGLGSTSCQDPGSGVHIMLSRARAVGATLRIAPAQPRGTRVLCTLERRTKQSA